VLGTGLGLATTRPGTYGPLFVAHKLGSIIWGVLLGTHLLTYLPRTPALITADWRGDPTTPAPGRVPRVLANLAAPAAGTAAAMLIEPTFAPWTTSPKSTGEVARRRMSASPAALLGRPGGSGG
jgi:hypothetical protein